MTELEAVSGVGPGTAKKLQDAFVTTAEILAVQNPIELQERTKIGEGTCQSIIRSARMLIGKYGFKTGLEIEEAMASSAKLTTGLARLDEALLGGIEEGSIIELYGPARGGKTHWCFYFAVRAQLPPDKGGLGGRVLWLDTESSFKPWVIRGIALRFGLDPETTLGNISLAEIFLSSQIPEVFENIPQMCAEQDYKLAVIDSFTGLFRAEYTGLNELRVRQQDMNRILNQMRRTGVATGATFVYTNQAMANISAYGGNPNAPVGGHILAHASDYRFYVRKLKDDERQIVLRDNAGVPEFHEKLKLGWGGFYEDSKSKKKHEPDILEKLRASGKAGFLEAEQKVEAEE